MNSPDTDVVDLVAEVRRLCKQVGLTGHSHNLLVGSLLSERVELRSPIPVVLEYDGQQYVASSVDLNVYGYGETEEAALDDFRRAVEDFYFSLHGEELGDDLMRRFSYLASIILEK
jgi:hypothetical protein